MTKRALCVGINHYPIVGADLRGCVNDANGWASLFTDHFDFASADIRMLTDDQATKANILAALKDLLAGARYGDVLAFTNSSHGSYVPDTSGDETDRYDEVICPFDIRDNPLVDDELRELFGDIPRGVRLTMVSDSCHSGSMTRVIPSEVFPGLSFRDDRRPRFLSPLMWAVPGKRGAKRARDVVLPDALASTPTRKVTYPQSSMHHLLLSGCKDTEVSYDANISADFHGAMTYFSLKAIADAGYSITYRDLETKVNELLADAGYPQHPQLEGRSEAKARQIFV
jgi:hypothetical protein